MRVGGALEGRGEGGRRWGGGRWGRGRGSRMRGCDLEGVYSTLSCLGLLGWIVYVCVMSMSEYGV